MNLVPFELGVQLLLGYKPLVIFLCALVTYNYLSSRHGHTLPTLPILSHLLLSCSPSVDALRILTCVLRTIGPKVYSFLMESLAGYHEEHDTSEASVEEVQLYGKTDSVLHWKRRVLGARVCE